MQLQRFSGRTFVNDGAPLKTNSGGYFSVKRARATYRYEGFTGSPSAATAVGFSRVALPR